MYVRRSECGDTRPGKPARATKPIHLSVRHERAAPYEAVLRIGHERELTEYIDGAVLADLWRELSIAEPIRRAGPR